MTRSEQMAMIRSCNTTIEVILRKELWRRGLRYRKNIKKIIGKPDIAFVGLKIAVFCDSEFWHGKDFLQGKIPKTNQEYWIPKLQKNIVRDQEVNSMLKKGSWTVLRFWEKDIKKNVESIADQIEQVVTNKKRTETAHKAKSPGELA